MIPYEERAYSESPSSWLQSECGWMPTYSCHVCFIWSHLLGQGWKCRELGLQLVDRPWVLLTYHIRHFRWRWEEIWCPLLYDNLLVVHVGWSNHPRHRLPVKRSRKSQLIICSISICVSLTSLPLRMHFSLGGMFWSTSKLRTIWRKACHHQLTSSASVSYVCIY